MKWFHAIMPKEAGFFDMFSRHAVTLVHGAEALRDMLEGGDKVIPAIERVVHYENEADAVAREVLTAIRRTFITPFDRSDIRGLINSLDDSIDQMQKTAKAIELYEVRAFEPQMREMGDIIVRSAGLTLEAVNGLSAMRQNTALLSKLTEQIVNLEEDADAIHEAGQKALWKANQDNAMAFIVGREIYSHLEKVMDRFEDVGNRINGILIEHL